MTADRAVPGPEAIKVPLVRRSVGFLVLCAVFLAVIVGFAAFSAVTDPTTTGIVLACVFGGPFAVALVWFCVRLPAMIRGAALAFDETGVWWTDGASGHLDVVPWARIAAVGIGVHRGRHGTNPLELSRSFEIYLTSAALSARHPRLAHFWRDVEPPRPDLPNRSYRLHISLKGGAEQIEQAVRRFRPQAWIGTWEHSRPPRLATDAEPAA